MSTPHDPRSRSTRVEDLFGQLSERLQAMVAAAAHTSPANIQDACAFAWSKLAQRPDVSEKVTPRVLGWLRMVAIHEAWRLHRVERTTLSLDADPELIEHRVAERLELAEAAVELDRMRRVMSEMPRRARVIFTLRLAGFSYAEIAEHQEVSLRVVNRQMVAARRFVRDKVQQGW